MKENQPKLTFPNIHLRVYIPKSTKQLWSPFENVVEKTEYLTNGLIETLRTIPLNMLDINVLFCFVILLLCFWLLILIEGLFSLLFLNKYFRIVKQVYVRSLPFSAI